MDKMTLTVSSSPHIRSKRTTQNIMADVVIALIPALLSGIIVFGLRALFITLLSVVSCISFEYIWCKLLKKQDSINDLSAVVTGMLLSFSMPVTVPFWIVLLGSFFSIVIVKQFFGGLGCNVLNPALAGRAFLLASWPVIMTKYPAPFTTGVFLNADVLTSATPLTLLKEGNIADLPVLSDMFLGNIGGSIGETSALALIIGGLYLIFRKVITPKIPLCFIGTVALLSLIFGYEGLSSIRGMLYSILGGSLLIGAIFMATDYVTSPVTPKGQIIMGVGCGILTFFIRKLGGYPEGITYAILLMNIATPLIDKYTRPKKFGYVKKGRK